MGIPGSANLLLLGGGAPAYEIEHSLRFDGGSQLNRTPTTGNGRIWSLSVWLKRSGGIGDNDRDILGAYVSPYSRIGLVECGAGPSADHFGIDQGGPSGNGNYYANGRRRDPSAWYHLVVSVNYNTPSVKIWVNGVLEGQASSSLAADGGLINSSSVPHAIGSRVTGASGNNRWLGYMAEFHFLDTDSQLSDPYDFGEFDDNGVWRPIEYTGSYGDNGSYLKFDPSATNGIGHDHSGNGNHWTPSGFTTSAPGNGRYAPDCSTVSGGGSFVAAFDGSISTGVGSENYSGEIWTWEPDTAYSYSSSVEIYGGEAAYDQARINGGSWQALNGGWKTLASGSGSITKIEVRDSRGNAAASFNAFRVDGTFLVDNVYNVTYDVVADTPTNNWSTLNPIHFVSTNGAEDGALVINSTSTAHRVNTGTVPLSSQGGKYYAECWVKVTTRLSNRAAGFGFQVGPNLNSPTSSNNYIIYSNNNQGRIVANGSTLATNISAAMARDGDVYQLAFDAATGKAWVGMNNTWLNSSGGSTGNPATGANPTFTLSGDVYTYASAYNNVVYVNFGQHDFVYDAPTGFDSVNTANMATPDIADGAKHFEPIIYTGDGNSTQTITTSFEPDFVWNKSRNQGFYPRVFDRLRGTLDKALYPSDNFTEDYITDYGEITATSATSVTVGQGGDSGNLINQSNYTHVLWNWKAGGSVSADNNTAGSITSTVSANTTAGFSIVTYTGTGTAATVGHGLGITPSFYVVKPRSYANNWPCWHKDLTNNGYYIHLNHSLKQDLATAVWNNTGPSDTVFNIGTNTNVNQLNATFVAYVFAEVEGYSHIAYYAGNGNGEGPFVNCGFRPSFVLIKNYRGGSETPWVIYDTARDTYNVSQHRLFPDLNNSEESDSTRGIDIVSNGFKIRGNHGSINESGSDYLFVALAENPFGGEGVSPATAR